MRKITIIIALIVLIVACSPSIEEEPPPVLSEVEEPVLSEVEEPVLSEVEEPVLNEIEEPTVAKEAKVTQPSPTPITSTETGETEEPAVDEMALPGQSVPTPPAGFIYHAVYPGEAIADSQPPPEDGIPFEEDGLTMEDLRSYEQHVGKTATWVYFSHNWFRERSFPLSTASWIRDAGSIPYIRLMLRSSSEQNVAEPTFTLDRIINGDFDDDLHVWARGARDFGSPLIAEYGTEANGEWFSWNGIWNGGGTQDGYGDPSEYDGPERFRDAYRHIIQIARDEGASNITWVFHANGEDIPDEAWNRLEEYYPGDEWVDWLGVSVYGALDPMDDEWPQFRDGMDAVYPRLAALSPDKPIVLLEFGVAAGNPLGDQAEWAEAALTDLVAFRWPRLIGFSWWNEHWENDDDPSHDSILRVQDNPDLAAVFQRLVGNESNVLGNYRPAFTFAYETRPDGAIRLTNPPSDTSDQNPAFSPDETLLLFTRFENGYNEGPAALYLLDLVSGNTNLLTAAPDSDSVNLPGTSWNAATNRITFASDREASDEIWTMATDGSDLFRVTNQATPGYAIEPSFSPDGQWIVFEFDNQVPDDKQQGSIWKIRTDGSELTPLLDGPNTGTDNRQPNWSPVGNRILFQRRIPGSDDWNLYTMDPNGSNIQPVTTASSSDTDASWSPDGQWIVYSSDYEDLPTPNIFIIPANGGDPVRITHSESYGDGAASWSPDGQWIAFESYPSLEDEETPATLWLIETLPLDAPLPPTTIKNQPPDKPHLAEVSTWFYMIDVNLEPEKVERMAASEYDMIVLDFIPSEANNIDYPMAEVVDRLHNAAHPKQVLAYIDIGQAEDFRTYWQPDWGIGNPEWIVGSDPDGWAGNYPVAYWYEQWQEIWLGPDGMLTAILDAGFDGIYLDWVEGYSDENVVAFAKSDGVDPRQEMIWWVEEIADFTHTQRADFIVIAQNAAELAQDDDYAEVIDAIAQEQVWFDGAADNKPPGDCPLPRAEAEVETNAYVAGLSEPCRTMYEEFPDSTLHVSSEEYLHDLTLAQNKGLLIFTVDYALKPENVAWVYETSRALGFVPFVGNRALNQYIAPVIIETDITPAAGKDWWQPGVDTTWQWQLSDQPIDQSYDVDMVDIEMFDNDASVVAALHSQGRKVVCYISVGSWEEWRPDADQFPAPVMGNDYEDWPGEKWLDIRQLDLLAPIMQARLDECQAKGFDGIEPDNIDGYTNDTGFSLTYEDQLNYNTWLATEAHTRDLSIGLKNDPDQVADLLPYFDWALTEDCFAEGWCEEMLPFIAAGKPVFAAEYTDTGITTDQFCPQAQEMGFSAILKNRNLEAYREACR